MPEVVEPTGLASINKIPGPIAAYLCHIAVVYTTAPRRFRYAAN